MKKKSLWLVGLACVAVSVLLLLFWPRSTEVDRSPVSRDHLIQTIERPAGRDSTTSRDRPRKASSVQPPRSARTQAGHAAQDGAKNLEKYVGEKTAAAISAGGPFEPFHVRTIARSLRNHEKYLAELRENDALPAEMKRATRTYARMQNHYYAALDDIEPYKPKAESTKRLEKWQKAVKSKGEELTREEMKALKREILLRKDDEGIRQ